MKTLLLAVLTAFLLVPTPAAHAEKIRRSVSTANMPPGWAWPPTEAMLASGQRCLAALSRAGVIHQTMTRSPGKITTPVVVPSMRFGPISVRQVYAKRPPVMDCHMALALAQNAPFLSEVGVRELVVAGFYQNRLARLRGRSVPLLSRHALGLAVDIRAFVTHEGRTLSVKHDYRHPLFAQIESALTRPQLLRAVVTPQNDRNHKNHFHISAKMTIDETQPDATVDVAQLLHQTDGRAAGARFRRVSYHQ